MEMRVTAIKVCANYVGDRIPIFPPIEYACDELGVIPRSVRIAYSKCPDESWLGWKITEVLEPVTRHNPESDDA